MQVHGIHIELTIPQNGYVSAPAHHFFTTSMGSNQSLKNYGFICNAIFFSCMHVHKDKNSNTAHHY